MKTTIRTWASALAFAVTAAIITGCGSSSPPVDVVVPPPAVTAPGVALQAVVKDASTGNPVAPVAPAVVTVSVYGADANKVVSYEGASIYSATNGFAGPFTTANGYLTIYVKPGTPVPSQMALRVVASANGYVTSSEDVVVKSTDLNSDGSTKGIDVNISLVKVSAPPPSVTVATEPVTVTAGVSPPTATTNTTPESTAVVNGSTVNLGSATVEVPATTAIYADAAKTVPLPSGSTNLIVTYNNSVTTNSLAAFPGGFTMSQDATGTALAAPAVFVTAGFASVELVVTAPDGTVTQAKTFDKPVSVTIPIPKGTISPATGLAVKAGDIISIWAYNSTTGAWGVLKLNNGTIVKGTLGALNASNNTFPVTFATDHLTYFAMGDVLAPAQQCTNAAINVIGAGTYELDFVFTKVGGGWSYQGTRPANSTRALTVPSAPAGPVTVQVYQKPAGTLINTLSVADLCASGGNSLTVTPAAIPVAGLTVTVRRVCSANASAFTLASGVKAQVRNVDTGVLAATAITNTTGVATFSNLNLGSYVAEAVDSAGQVLATSSMTSLATGDAKSATLDISTTCSVISGG